MAKTLTLTAHSAEENTMSSKSKTSKKSEKSEKHEKPSSKHTGAKIAECMKEVMSLVTKKPKHYTKRYLASQKKLGEKYGAEIVRKAIDSMEEMDKVGYSQIPPKKGEEKGYYVLFPLVKKAA